MMKTLLIFLSMLTPLAYLILELFIFQSVADPIKYIYTVTGASATVILFFTITLSLMKKRINLIKYRRMIGLTGFFYAFLHFLNFFILDAELDFAFVIEESIDKPFVYLGMLALFILIFMAITSTKKLFKKYNKWHKLIYLALTFITIHFIMAQKSLSVLQFGFVLIILIIAYCKLYQYIVKKNRLN